MGVLPVSPSAYEELSKLSNEDKIKVIAWMADTMLPEEREVSSGVVVEDPAADWLPAEMEVPDDNTSGPIWYEKVDSPGSHLTSEEWDSRVKAGAGLWSDLPDDFGDDIVSSRTISTKEVNLDD